MKKIYEKLYVFYIAPQHMIFSMYRVCHGNSSQYQILYDNNWFKFQL